MGVLECHKEVFIKYANESKVNFKKRLTTLGNQRWIICLFFSGILPYFSLLFQNKNQYSIKECIELYAQLLMIAVLMFWTCCAHYGINSLLAANV